MSKKPDISYCGYKPNQKVDKLYIRDGVKYWVGPYLVFDPELEINTSKGQMKRKLKDHQISRLTNHVPVCNSLDGKAIVIHKDRIRPHKKDAVTFAHVFGTVNSGGIILAGASYEKAEDLSLGIESITELDN
jgi:hypothetical protein